MTNNVTLVFHDGTRVTVSGAELTVERQEWKWNFVEDENGCMNAEKEIIAYQYTTEEKKNKVKDIKTNGVDSSYYSTFIDGNL